MTLNYPIPAQRRKTLPPPKPRKFWEDLLEQIRNEEKDEEKNREINYRNLLSNIHPWKILPPSFPMPLDPMFVLFNADTNTDVFVKSYDDLVDYFELSNLDFFLSKEEFYDSSRSSFDFGATSENDLNVQYWTRYICMLPLGWESPLAKSAGDML